MSYYKAIHIARYSVSEIRRVTLMFYIESHLHMLNECDGLSLNEIIILGQYNSVILLLLLFALILDAHFDHLCTTQ